MSFPCCRFKGAHYGYVWCRKGFLFALWFTECIKLSAFVQTKFWSVEFVYTTKLSTLHPIGKRLGFSIAAINFFRYRSVRFLENVLENRAVCILTTPVLGTDWRRIYIDSL